MPALTQSTQFRPHGAPAYYLARPVSWWITALRHQAQQRAEGGETRVPTPRRGPGRVSHRLANPPRRLHVTHPNTARRSASSPVRSHDRKEWPSRPARRGTAAEGKEARS